MSRKMKSILKSAGIIAICVALCATLGFATKGFTERNPEDWIVRERNDLNLFDNTRLSDETIKDGTGLVVTMKKDGSVIVDGKSGATEATVIELGEVTLKPGTYTFTSGYKKAGLYSAYLKLQMDGSFKTADFDGHDNIVITSETTATVELVINPDVDFNHATLYPVIAEGSESVDFYE